MEAGDEARRYARRSVAQWRELVRQCAQSGLSQTAFCQSHGVAVSSLHHWRRKLGDEVRGRGAGDADAAAAPADAERAGFVELRPVDPSVRQPVPAWDVELTLGDGIVLRLRGGHAQYR